MLGLYLKHLPKTAQLLSLVWLWSARWEITRGKIRIWKRVLTDLSSHQRRWMRRQIGTQRGRSTGRAVEPGRELGLGEMSSLQEWLNQSWEIIDDTTTFKAWQVFLRFSLNPPFPAATEKPKSQRSARNAYLRCSLYGSTGLAYYSKAAEAINAHCYMHF